MAITSQHVTGFVFGLGASALTYYAYKKNQGRIDEFLRKQGINLPIAEGQRDFSTLSLEDLVGEKERLEDLIAEREHAGKAEPAEG